MFAGLEQLEPWLAVLIGVLWVMAEMHCTYMYDGKDGFWIGAFATLLVLLYAQFDKAHPLVHTIPSTKFAVGHMHDQRGHACQQGLWRAIG